jgi:signal transduction histidine kinase
MIAAVLLLMNTYFLTYSRDMIFTTKRVFVQAQASVIETALGDLDKMAPDGVSRVMARLDVRGLGRVTVFAVGGTVLYDTPGARAVPVGSFVWENLDVALGGRDVTRTSFSGGAFTSAALVPVMRRGAAVAAVYVSETDAEQGAILLGLQNTIRYISFVIAALSVVLLAFITWTVMRRITSVLRAISSVREGEYGYRIDMRGRDELALLGYEFNSLTDRLRETEEKRRRFVADASHELKTPLASIRLLSDSILQNEGIDAETVREFVADIGEESARLARTTEKLMALTRIDSGALFESVPVDVMDVVTATLRMLRPLAASVGVIIESRLDSGCVVSATEDALHQIVFNLVENAIKYNAQGGRVIVHLRRGAEAAVLTVDDTGIGVPEDDLPYIFDRFYRVDKARSRASGGSGLGLAIVRDTVREYGGTITVRRRDEGGMRFEVRFGLVEGDSGALRRINS